MLDILRPCIYEKLLLHYYVNNHYSGVSCMSMHNSEFLDLEKILGSTNWTFSNKYLECVHMHW